MEVPYKLEMLILATIAVKIGISLYPYSGKGTPPMYGDYEAQRHWMEITVNLPIKDWYQNTTENDLMYWGLDYPPLTAYHSYLVGLVAKHIDADYVALFTSRGYESINHQFFMRMSVLISDIIVCITALYYYVKSISYATKFQWILFGICCHPGILLIDYGHFQYNCVSLGLTLWAIVFIYKRYWLCAAIAFSLAINFKQMELYHALPIFFYLLAHCRSQATPVAKVTMLAKIGAVTLASFVLIWFPFLDFQNGQFIQVLSRIFPFYRGLFEDYVANFWCTLNVAWKIKRYLNSSTLAKLCLALTAFTSFPCSIHLLFSPSFRNFLLSLINVSLSFFLFSYHVHEKSILLVTLPISLFIPYDPLPCMWFLWVAHFSMLPLYVKDGLVIPFYSTWMLYSILAYNGTSFKWTLSKASLLASISFIGCVVCSVLSLICSPPAAYPFLWPLIISVFSFLHFQAFFLYFLYRQFYARC